MIRVVCCCLALAGVGLTSCSESRSGAAPREIGINSDITWGVPAADVSTEVAMMKYAGVKWIRATVDLGGAEPLGPGRLDRRYLRSVDRAIRTARAAGLNVEMEFDRAPYWASADPARTSVGGSERWRPYWTYREPQDYGRIVADLVRRYSPMGVHAFELWNEPNNPRFWPSGVNAADYVLLLRAGYSAVKSVDPSATVAMGGLMPQGAVAYLGELYISGARGAYNVANFHIYPQAAPCSGAGMCLLDALHAEMVDHGDSAPAWITELGWSTCDSGPCVSRDHQASYVSDTFRLLTLPRYAWIQQTFLYQLRDLLGTTAPGDWESNLGVLSRSLDPKPAYQALEAAAGTAPGPPRSRASITLGLKRAVRTRHSRRFTVTALGRVRGYSGGQVLLIVQRQVGGDWGTSRARVRPLGAGGAYRLRMRWGAGRWRVRALYDGALSVVRVTEYRS